MADDFPEFPERARAWLTSLPHGAEIRWGHDLKLHAPDAHTGWIDVISPDGCKATGSNWLITFLGALEPDETLDPDAEVLLPFDIAVQGEWDDDAHGFRDGTVQILDTPQEFSDIDGVVTRPAWRTSTLCAALSAWSQRVAGRGDLVWVFDHDVMSNLLRKAQATWEEMQAGTAETYDLGDDIMATGSAFDTLLEVGPDTAAELIDKIKDAVRGTKSP